MTAAPGAGEPVVGLVLSGGGARSSFQLGALRYLYDEVRIAPSVIAGTSAGSILGAVLAQDADHEGQRARLDRLEELWRGMESSADMFTELPWFERLRERGPVWMHALDRRKHRQGVLGRSFKRRTDLRHGTSQPLPTEVPAAPPSRTAAPADDTVPSTTATRQPTAEDQRAESSWIPAKLLESIETLRTMGRASSDVEEILTGAQRERSMFRPGPLVDRLVDPEMFDPAAVAASGVTCRIAVVALESGELRYVTETGALVDREDRPVEAGTTVDLVDAVRASCAIPMVFPPVRLGEENYVDGGVRESLPAEIAMTHLGVDTCYAVVAGPSVGLPREESYDDKDMLSIVMRTTTAIMTDELQRDEVVHARAGGAVVIEPEFDVHDTLSVDPGLVAIAMDYGYLRAAEAHQGATADEQRVTRDLISLRRVIWQAEKRAFDPGAPRSTSQNEAPDEPGTEQLEQVAEIAGLKHELRDLLAKVPAGRLPAGAEDWWRTWETHVVDIPVSPSWATAEGS